MSETATSIPFCSITTRRNCPDVSPSRYVCVSRAAISRSTGMPGSSLCASCRAVCEKKVGDKQEIHITTVINFIVSLPIPIRMNGAQHYGCAWGTFGSRLNDGLFASSVVDQNEG